MISGVPITPSTRFWKVGLNPGSCLFIRLFHPLICLVLCSLIFIPGAAATKPSGRTTAERRFHALLDSEWDYRLRQSPTLASGMGDRRWNDRWDDVSLQAIEQRRQHAILLLQQLQKLDRRKLGTADQLNYDLYLREVRLDIEEFQQRWFLIPLNQREGIQTADELIDNLNFETERDFQDWTARLRSFGSYMDQTLALMREGIRVRRVLPKIIVQRLPSQIAKQRVDSPEKSPFYRPFLAFPASIPVEVQLRLGREAADAIQNVVLPAYARMDQFIREEYLPASFDLVGIWQMPDGADLYRFFARKFTTTDMTPDEIHERGLAEVARIRAEMERIKSRVEFKGELKEFFEFLRTDPRFFYKTREELLDAYRSASKKVDPLLVRLFRTLPRIPYGVEPIPDKIAPDTTMAYYRPPAADGSRAGYYSVNLYRPETRPKHEMMALTLHEAVPGHHLQIALSMEQGELPHFRRYGGYTAFVEGWALYAEALGEEMGLYEDPYDKMGQLTYEMWRAVRLVVDTGIHFKRWTRQQAIDYFMANAAKTELDVVNEIDRYIAWPGQALAYKIGELKIKELRAMSEKELGSRFDIKEFHDVILLAGALPLDQLERRVLEYISTAARRDGTEKR